MIRRTITSVVLAGAVITGPVLAGGWGVITVGNLPDFAEVGKPLSLSFTVMGHGRARAAGLRGSIDAVSGGQLVSAPISESAEAGLYTASIVLPRPGDWVLTINAGYRVSLLPITAVDAGTHAPVSISDAERGRRLFVAKGCATCHQHNLRTPNHSANVGPALVPHKFQADFLERMLADPERTIPPRPESPVRMPNLHLNQREIASLVAFINSGTLAAGR